MRLERLVVERFRNLDSLDINVDAPYVVLSGPNAQGKTNALEAIHLLATLKPLRGRRVQLSGTASVGLGIANCGVPSNNQ